jgi:hypothetical protein
MAGSSLSYRRRKIYSANLGWPTKGTAHIASYPTEPCEGAKHHACRMHGDRR